MSLTHCQLHTIPRKLQSNSTAQTPGGASDQCDCHSSYRLLRFLFPREDDIDTTETRSAEDKFSQLCAPRCPHRTDSPHAMTVGDEHRLPRDSRQNGPGLPKPNWGLEGRLSVWAAHYHLCQRSGVALTTHQLTK